MRNRLAFGLACSLGVLGALPLYAGDVTYKACAGNPSKADEDAARGLFAAGRTAYEESDYPKAIQYWRDAFERDCTANLLLVNLANAYEKKGELDAAITSLETYLKRNPKADDASTIQKRIDNMRKLRAPAATSSAPPPKPTASQTSAPPPSTSASVDGSSSNLGPFIVMGAGGVLTIVGGVMYLGGSSKIDDAEKLCPERKNCSAEAADKGNSGRSQKQLGGILAGVGVLAIGGGAAWYFMEKGKKNTAVAPILAPGVAGVGVAGRF